MKQDPQNEEDDGVFHLERLKFAVPDDVLQRLHGKVHDGEARKEPVTSDEAKELLDRE